MLHANNTVRVITMLADRGRRYQRNDAAGRCKGFQAVRVPRLYNETNASIRVYRNNRCFGMPYATLSPNAGVELPRMQSFMPTG